MVKNSAEMAQIVESSEELLAKEIEAVKLKTEKLGKRLNKYIQANGSSPGLKEKCRHLFSSDTCDIEKAKA